MEHYVALDVSLKEISICVLDEKGGVVFEGKTAADPSALVDLIRSEAPGVVRVGLETGATTPWLFHSLTAAGLRVICMDTRPCQRGAVDAAEEVGPQRCPGIGRYSPDGLVSRGQGKSLPAHERRALLATRHRLVTIRTELDAQLRGLLKTFGLVVGPGNIDVLVRKAEALSEGFR